jgi:hypothetical protein
MYGSEEEAGQAWDRVAWVYRGKVKDLNYPHLLPQYDTQVRAVRRPKKGSVV